MAFFRFGSSKMADVRHRGIVVRVFGFGPLTKGIWCILYSVRNLVRIDTVSGSDSEHPARLFVVVRDPGVVRRRAVVPGANEWRMIHRRPPIPHLSILH